MIGGMPTLPKTTKIKSRAMKKLFLLLFVSYLLIGCLFGFDGVGGCIHDINYGKTFPHPDNEKNTIKPNDKKVLYIHNKTNNAYKNNKLLWLSLQKEIATDKYVLLFDSIALEKKDKDDSFYCKDYSFPDINPGGTAVKKQKKHRGDSYFYNFFNLVDVSNKFKDTEYSVYLAYLGGGKRKVFFGEDKKGSKYALRVDEYDDEPRSDGYCYHTQYYQYKDIFVSDTHITLENDKATSNHKVVTHITLDGKRIELATMSIKKTISRYIKDKYKHEFVRVEDFK